MTQLIGRMISNLGKYSDPVPSDNKNRLGGAMWKALTYSQKRTYLALTGLVMQPQDTDEHIGDANFQARLIGAVDRYISLANDLMSDYYTIGDKDKRTFDFPQKLKETIVTSKSAFNPSKLLENTASYIERASQRKMVLKENDAVVKLVFEHWDRMFEGIKAISEMESAAQQELILTGLAPNTNSGYPFFVRQTKDNFGRKFTDFLTQYLPAVKHKHATDIGNGISLTVPIIFDAIKEANKIGYYPPFTLFYRTQSGRLGDTKHRSVFGGDVLMKALGSLWSAAKNNFYDKETYRALSPKTPWVAWEEWTQMFNGILECMPTIDQDGNLEPMSAERINSFSRLKVQKEAYVDVYGEDFSGYDQTIIREDLQWITRHKKVGFIMKWILDCCSESEVWAGPERIHGIFFKSGHPFTSEFGSIWHQTFLHNISDMSESMTLLNAIVLSDDNLGWWLNFDERILLGYAEELGMTIDPAKSSWFSRDKIVSFLKVLVGYVFTKESIRYVGDIISRYVSFVRSERAIEQDLSAPRGTYNITGNKEIDAGLSKAGSYSEEGAPFVEFILKVVAGTPLGMDMIKAIMEMSLRYYEMYRDDIPSTAFGPGWLPDKIDVRGLALDQPLK